MNMVYVEKKFVSKFTGRKRIEVVVNDSDSQKIIEDVKNKEIYMVRYLLGIF